MADIDIADDTLLTLTADIVAAHVSNNSVAVNDLPILIQNVHQALAGINALDRRARSPARAGGVGPLVDQARLYRLPRGRQEAQDAQAPLMTHYSMTPDDYRRKWGLTADYPMVAPNYAEQRRALAKSIGLGTKGGRRKKAK